MPGQLQERRSVAAVAQSLKGPAIQRLLTALGAEQGAEPGALLQKTLTARAVQQIAQPIRRQGAPPAKEGHPYAHPRPGTLRLLALLNQLHHRDLSTVLALRRVAAMGAGDHVEHHAVVPWVQVVAMLSPAARLPVKLNVAAYGG